MATCRPRTLAVVDADVEHDDDEDEDYVGHEPGSSIGVLFSRSFANLYHVQGELIYHES